MELDSQTMRRVWWKGALAAAAKGIPQGLLLGAIGFGLLAGGIYLFGATSLVGSFGTFLFTGAADATAAVTTGGFAAYMATLSPLTFITLNTTLTVVGNFLTGGNIACNAYKQDVEHQMNKQRITQIEAREQALEQTVAPSRAVASILAKGPRAQDSFAKAEHARGDVPPSERTIH